MGKEKIGMGEIFGVKVGSGVVHLTNGETERVVHMADEDTPFTFTTFDKDTFDVVLGGTFFETRSHTWHLSSQVPHHVLVRRQGH